MNLTPGFTVVDYQATPSGYYRIMFRSASGDYMTATQHGRGGSNIYAHTTLSTKHDFDEWLAANATLAVDHLTELGYPDLAAVVTARGLEWQDSVVMSICDLIDMGQLTVTG